MTDTTDPDTAPEPAAPPTLYGVPLSDSRGQRVLHPSRDNYVATVRALLDDSYTMCADLTAVDYLQHPYRPLPIGVDAERFEVVVNLLSIDRRDRIRLRVQVPADDTNVPTLFDCYPGTEAMEREVFDMFGIAFTDHPDLTRILMPEDWEGHPLRKDDHPSRIAVQFTADFSTQQVEP
ncbi:MAG: NADH-quinone oxidoreductase subunit C [Actinomycetota bacterium]